ncbi:MAG: class II fructose-bisphosphate aldolase [Candidatus Beckwithbacteria bacterium]
MDLIKEMVEVREGKVTAVVENNLKERWDELAEKAVFGDEEEKRQAGWVIWEVGQFVGVRPASINDLYMARGRGEAPLNFTVPAINVRGMAYDFSRAIFKSAQESRVGTLIVEIAKSELDYTGQTPEELVTVVLAAAIREGWRGGLAFQLDHWENPDGVAEAIKAGFLNIDIDKSLLPLKANINQTVKMIELIRGIEPEGVTMSLGGEIGHIGDKNTTTAEVEAYINGINQSLKKGIVGLSKISVATGTHHGGVMLADGTLAEVKVDFKALGEISRICRRSGMAGAVQHGASTLREKYFKEFVKSETAEVHLATEFQNIIMDHPSFPKDLLEKMYQWLDSEDVEPAHYSLRKKAWGKFKKECWQIDSGVREKIREALEQKLKFFYKELGVEGTGLLAKKWLKPVERHKEL